MVVQSDRPLSPTDCCFSHSVNKLPKLTQNSMLLIRLCDRFEQQIMGQVI